MPLTRIPVKNLSRLASDYFPASIVQVHLPHGPLDASLTATPALATRTRATQKRARWRLDQGRNKSCGYGMRYRFATCPRRPAFTPDINYLAICCRDAIVVDVDDVGMASTIYDTPSSEAYDGGRRPPLAMCSCPDSMSDTGSCLFAASFRCQYSRFGSSRCSSLV